MAVGLANADFDLRRQPGWEPWLAAPATATASSRGVDLGGRCLCSPARLRRSYGYHGEDGRKFYNSSRGEPYGGKCVASPRPLPPGNMLPAWRLLLGALAPFAYAVAADPLALGGQVHI